MPRLPTKTTLRNKADKLFGQLVRGRGKCEMGGTGMCSSKETLQCAHIYSRKYVNMRWDPRNALCLCASHHFWGHHNPLDFAFWVEKNRNSDIEYLMAKRNKLEKTNYELVVENLEKMLLSKQYYG